MSIDMEKLSYLLKIYPEDYLEDKVCYFFRGKHHNLCQMAAELYLLMECYIDISTAYFGRCSYETVKDYFLKNIYTFEEYHRFERIRRLGWKFYKKSLISSKEKLQYLFSFFDEYMDMYIQNILNDSKVDPHFSRVCASNMIICYLSVLQDIGCQLSVQSVKGYFEKRGYSESVYGFFEQGRLEESIDYRGVQYEE